MISFFISYKKLAKILILLTALFFSYNSYLLCQTIKSSQSIPHNSSKTKKTLRPQQLITKTQQSSLRPNSARQLNLNNNKKNINQFNRFFINEPLASKDWTYFKTKSFYWKTEFWNYHKSLKTKFSSWHWVWRMAWVQACAEKQKMQSKTCRDIFDAAQKDDALVVRSEVVTILGGLYEGTESEEVVKRLDQIYQDPRNYRNGTALFIVHNIYNSLQKVGGTAGIKLSAKMIEEHPKIKNSPFRIKKTF